MIAEHVITRRTAADGLSPGARGQLVDLVGAEQAERDDLVMERPFSNHGVSRSLALVHIGLEMIAAVGSLVRQRRPRVEAASQRCRARYASAGFVICERAVGLVFEQQENH